MKASEKLTFSKLQNEYLENILRQLVHQYNIIQMFFTRERSSTLSHLIVHIEQSADAKNLQENKWVKKVRKRFQIDVYFIYSSKLQHRFSLGYPFIELYCHPSAVIYQNTASEDSIVNTRDWKKYKKRFNVLKEYFYHDHDLHKSQIKNLISEGSSNSVFTSYARLIEFDLEYLEELYAGKKSDFLNLDERITNLIEYIPAIQKYFVKKSRSSYYLTDLFAQAKEAASDDDEVYKEEMYEAVGITERSLYLLIDERFDEFKKLIKKGYTEKKEVSCQIDEKTKDAILDTSVKTILKSVEAEQIYLYHQITCHEKLTFYLMLITADAGNEKLKVITDYLKNETGGKYNFVLISHSRYWIQNNLYGYQSFFSKIIQDNNLIYSSSECHPVFHWEVPHKPYHGDLHFFFKSTKESALQFFEIANNNKDNYCSLDSLFALFFLSFCRTYIFVKTYYIPNYLSSQTLWELCIYADPDIRKHNYLLEQFWIDFFPYLDKHRTVFQVLSSNLDKEKVVQMNVIVEKLMNELDNLVIENGLLLSFEQV